MRLHNWAFKVITVYTNNVTSTSYYSNYPSVKQFKAGTVTGEQTLKNRGLIKEDTVTFKVFPYGGVIN